MVLLQLLWNERITFYLMIFQPSMTLTTLPNTLPVIETDAPLSNDFEILGLSRDWSLVYVTSLRVSYVRSPAGL